MLAVRKPVAKGGRFFHIKSDAWATELSSVPSQLFSFWTPSLLGQYRIPETSVDMAVVLTEKIAE
jgi:16S rRNA (guanine527-N7)-methyltransferase